MEISQLKFHSEKPKMRFWEPCIKKESESFELNEILCCSLFDKNLIIVVV
jgi:hypothetical protein